MYSIARAKILPTTLPVCMQVRWKRIPGGRKPRWLPMARSKIFNIPKHPYVAPDEKELFDDLFEEYYRKVDSLRKHFQEELNASSDNEHIKLSEQEKEKFLLEENRKENERIRIIRESTLEKEFQEKQLKLLQLEEERKKELEITKLKIEDVVRKEKEERMGFITKENLDTVIEEALDNPVNFNFSLNLEGIVTWEGKPSLEYESDIMSRVEQGRKIKQFK